MLETVKQIRNKNVDKNVTTTHPLLYQTNAVSQSLKTISAM